MNQNILLLTDYNNLYRQGIYRSEGIDLEKFKQVLAEHGCTVLQVTYSDLLNQFFDKEWKNYNVIYTSSQNHEYKEYIKDIIYEIGKKNKLIPSYDFLMCHEDKVYQEIFKKSLGVKSLDVKIYATIKDLSKDIGTLQYPIVIKKTTGAGSISVYKAESEKDLLKIAKKMMKDKYYYEYYLKAIYKKLKGSWNKHYLEDEKLFGRIVLQQYIPGLEYDWKILIFGEKYYALRRQVRKHDFRASGSGMFSFEVPDNHILSYAEEIYEKMHTPFLSLDLCMDQRGKVYLIEFQGIHFGPYTLINSPHYFIHDSEWHKIEGISNLAEEYALAIIKYLGSTERST